MSKRESCRVCPHKPLHNCEYLHMIKPIDDEQLAETLKTIVRYWSLSRLPALTQACAERSGSLHQRQMV